MPDDAYTEMMNAPIAQGPFYPEAMGAFLHRVYNAEPEPGPPYTHTFRPSPQEYDEDGEPIPMPLEPTHTLTEVTFDSDEYDGPDLGSSAFVAPKAGWYRVEKRISDG